MHTWRVPRSIIAALVLSAVLWIIAASAAFGQDINVQKHYRMFQLTPEPELELTLRTEYHLMVGVERTVSLVFGGVEGEPQPRMVAVVAGFNEYEGNALCFIVDEIDGVTPPEMLGVRACFVYDREADTMSPINDPDGIVLEDCGEDHTLRPSDNPRPRGT